MSRDPQDQIRGQNQGQKVISPERADSENFPLNVEIGLRQHKAFTSHHPGHAEYQH